MPILLLLILLLPATAPRAFAESPVHAARTASESPPPSKAEENALRPEEIGALERIEAGEKTALALFGAGALGVGGLFYWISRQETDPQVERVADPASHWNQALGFAALTGAAAGAAWLYRSCRGPHRGGEGGWSWAALALPAPSEPGFAPLYALRLSHPLSF